MAKSIKLKNDTYWDTSSITHNNQKLNAYIANNVNMVITGKFSDKKWVKIANIRLKEHYQGSFAYLKIFIATGNNGGTNQNAYIDLIMQSGWTGDNGGRFGCNAELHPLKTPFTTDNTNIKVIANSNIDYDIWIYVANVMYCNPNYIVFAKNDSIVTPKNELSDTEPTGTTCNLSYVSV